MVVVKPPSEEKPSMGKSIRKLSTVTRVGLDLAKRVFQVHAVDAKGEIVVALTDRDCGHFSHPGNPVGLPGLRGGAERIQTAMLFGDAFG
jgi:hypothetical protein